MKRLLIAVTFLITGTTFAVETPIDQKALENFLTAQQALQTQLTLFCDGKTSDPATPLQQAIVSWFTVQALQLPATEFMQTDYVYVFWPDSKDRLKKQVTNAVTQPPTAMDWNAQPASVKSLSAIEFLLQSEKPTQYCAWFSAITDYQLDQAKQLKGLQEFYDFGETERLTALHGTALTMRSILKEVLSRKDKTLWLLGPGWRSNSGAPVLTALAEQSKALLKTFEAQNQGINDWIKASQDFSPFSQQASYQQLNQWSQYGENLARFVEQQLAPSLDINMGFNNFDGD